MFPTCFKWSLISGFGSTASSSFQSSLQGEIDVFLGQMVEYLRPLILWGCLALPTQSPRNSFGKQWCWLGLLILWVIWHSLLLILLVSLKCSLQKPIFHCASVRNFKRISVAYFEYSGGQKCVWGSEQARPGEMRNVKKLPCFLTAWIFLLESDGSGSSDLCWLEGCEKWWSWLSLMCVCFSSPSITNMATCSVYTVIYSWLEASSYINVRLRRQDYSKRALSFLVILGKSCQPASPFVKLGYCSSNSWPPKKRGRSGIASTPPVLPKWYPVVTSLFFYAEALTESPIELGEDVNGDATWRLQNWKKKVQLERLFLWKFFGPPKSTKSTGFYWNSQY